MQIIELLLICLTQIVIFLLFKKKFYNSKIVNKLLDKPGNDKIHSTPIPLVGGLLLTVSIFVYLILSFILSEYQFLNKKISILIIGGLFAFLIGVVDDFLHIKAEKKIIAVSIFNIIFFQKLGFFQVETLLFESNYFFLQISSVSLSLIISIIAFLICHYALVILDGVNGIFGVYAISLFTIILLFFEISYALENFIFYLIIILLFITFLNLRNNLFFGNSGSLMLSALIPYILLSIYNERNNQIFLFSYISLIIVPVLDMIRLFFLRLFEKRSPFSKDLNHIHHKLLKKFTLKWTLFIYLSLSFIPFLVIEIFYLDPLTILILQIIFFFTLNKALKTQKN